MNAHLLGFTPLQTAGRRVCLSFRDIEKSHRILDELMAYNAPYYGISARALCREPFYPLLLFVEALVYQADVEIEAGQRGEIPFTDNQPWLDRHAMLLPVLAELGIDDEDVARESLNLARYWQLENESLRAMQAGTLTEELVRQTVDLRSSDLMMLHHLLHRFLEIPRDAATFRALLAWEVMLEIEWDLEEYADEIATNDYNSYRMFVSLYGKDAPTRIEAERMRRQRVFEERVAVLTSPRSAELRSLLPQLHEHRPRPAVPVPVLEDWSSLHPVGEARRAAV